MQENTSIQLQRAMNDVQQINAVPLNYLESTIEKYPWFTKAQQLLAKKYQLENSDKFSAQLQKTALHSTDRKILFELIEQTPIQIAKPVETIAVQVVEPLIVTVEQVQEEKIEPIVLELNLEKSMNEFDSIITEKIIPTNFSIVEIQQEKFIENNNIVINNEPIFLRTETEPMTNENEPSENKTTTNDSPKSFNGWLKQFSKGSSIHTEKIVEKKKQETLQQAKALMNEYLGTNDEEDDEVDDLKVDLVEIMSFSMQQHDEFVTETMAKLYVQQEKYDKAIATYEKLSLLKPEKSVLFAAQIQEIKNKFK